MHTVSHTLLFCRTHRVMISSSSDKETCARCQTAEGRMCQIPRRVKGWGRIECDTIVRSVLCFDRYLFNKRDLTIESYLILPNPLVTASTCSRRTNEHAYLEIFVVFRHHVRREVERKRRQPNLFHSLPQGTQSCGRDQRMRESLAKDSDGRVQLGMLPR